MDDSNKIPPTDAQQIPPETEKSKLLWYVLGALALVVIVAGGAFLWKGESRFVIPSTQMQIGSAPLPRSRAPGIVTNISTAASVDTKGNPVASTPTFAVTDENVHLVASVAAPVVGTKIEYIRYLNGKYLDNGTLKITKPNLTHVSFVWALKKPGAQRLVGTYRVKVYTNGVFEKELTYVVR